MENVKFAILIFPQESKEIISENGGINLLARCTHEARSQVPPKREKNTKDRLRKRDARRADPKGRRPQTQIDQFLSRVKRKAKGKKKLGLPLLCTLRHRTHVGVFHAVVLGLVFAEGVRLLVSLGVGAQVDV